MQAEINSAIYAHVTAITDLPIVYPNIDAENEQTHIRVNVLPAPANDIAKCITDFNGVFDIQVWIREGSGTISALEIADSLILNTPKNSELTEGEITFRISSTGSPAPFVKAGNGWWFVPVNFNYSTL